jgi:hypothetical protein
MTDTHTGSNTKILDISRYDFLDDHGYTTTRTCLDGSQIWFIIQASLRREVSSDLMVSQLRRSDHSEWKVRKTG